MKKVLLSLILSEVILFASDRNIEIMPSVNENSSKDYSQRKQSDSTATTRNKTQSRVNRILKMKALREKIIAKQKKVSALKRSKIQNQQNQKSKTKKTLKKIRAIRNH